MRPHAIAFVAALALALAPACGGGDSASIFDPTADPGADASGGGDASGDDADDAAPEDATSEDAPGEDAVADDAEAPDDATSEGGADATDDAGPTCPPGVVTKPPSCPALCNGGCDGDRCRIVCNGISSCGARTLTCPPGMRCRIECTGISSCGGLAVKCADTAPCEVVCGATSSCGNVRLDCPAAAPCSIACSGTSSCNGGQVKCGKGACSATCSAIGAGLASVECGASCLCNKKC